MVRKTERTSTRRAGGIPPAPRDLCTSPDRPCTRPRRAATIARPRRRGDRVSNRREFITLAGGALLAWPAFAQGIGRWTVGTPMPSARTEVAVAEVGGKIYVVGGFGGERELEVYDPGTDRWSRGASIPRALHHAAAGGFQAKAYVVAGLVAGWAPTDDGDGS